MKPGTRQGRVALQISPSLHLSSSPLACAVALETEQSGTMDLDEKRAAEFLFHPQSGMGPPCDSRSPRGLPRLRIFALQKISAAANWLSEDGYWRHGVLRGWKGAVSNA
jgi:hypothetical protein